MRVLLITQNDPFYLGESLEYLLQNLPRGVDVVGCCLFDASPFGKHESSVKKVIRTVRVFGMKFFIRYALRFALSNIGRKRQVQNVLQQHNVPEIKITGSINDRDSVSRMKRAKPDLLVSIAGNQIYRKPVIELAPYGCLNLHTALLPRYRGLMPSFWVLKNDEGYTGVSVFFVDEGVDSGPIVVQKKVEIGDRTLEELIRLTKKLGMESVIEAIEKVRSGNFYLQENSDSESSYYSFPTAADVAEFRSSGKRFY